jgi:hypothetical protein
MQAFVKLASCLFGTIVELFGHLQHLSGVFFFTRKAASLSVFSSHSLCLTILTFSCFAFASASCCFKLLAATFLEFLLRFLLFHAFAHLRFPHLPRRPEHCRTLVFFVLLNVHSVALLLVLLFGSKGIA